MRSSMTWWIHSNESMSNWGRTCHGQNVTIFEHPGYLIGQSHPSWSHLWSPIVYCATASWTVHWAVVFYFFPFVRSCWWCAMSSLHFYNKTGQKTPFSHILLAHWCYHHIRIEFNGNFRIWILFCLRKSSEWANSMRALQLEEVYMFE